MTATITIGIDPTIEIGAVTVAWHGLMIAVGILVPHGFTTRTRPGRTAAAPDSGA